LRDWEEVDRGTTKTDWIPSGGYDMGTKITMPCIGLPMSHPFSSCPLDIYNLAVCCFQREDSKKEKRHLVSKMVRGSVYGYLVPSFE
jgi:hypothetical protein